MHKTRLQISSKGTIKVFGRSLTLASMCFLFVLMYAHFMLSQERGFSMKIPVIIFFIVKVTVVVIVLTKSINYFQILYCIKHVNIFCQNPIKP